MKLIDKLMELNGHDKDRAEEDCPLNYPEEMFPTVAHSCDEDCESCQEQELP